MATIEEIAKEAVAALDSEAGYLLAVKWANSRYQQMVARARFMHLRETADIAVAAGGISWDCPTDLRWFGTVIYYSAASTPVRVVQRVTIEELDDWYGDRVIATSPTGGPRVYAEKGMNAGATAKQIEVYPTCPATAGSKLAIVYWEEPTALTITSSLPYGIDDHIIREGILVDLMRWEAAKATRVGSREQAILWNERTKEQEIRWEQAILEAIRSDRGDADDVMIIEQKARTGIQMPLASTAKYPSR
jgi:hypothetical protein